MGSILIFLSGLLFSLSLWADEGLFSPHQIQSLPNAKSTIGAVIRVRPLIKFDIWVFATEKEKQNYEKNPGTRDKKFLPQGGTIWPTIATKAEMDIACEDPGVSLKPGFLDICNTYRTFCSSLPCHTGTDFLKDSASGFFISRQGHFLTNYHVARECIERLGRTNGSEEAEECLDLEVEVPEWVGNSLNPVYRKVSGKIMLLRNLSQTEWRVHGNDFALLKIDYTPKSFLEMDPSPISIGSQLWAVGFPAITRRSPEALRRVGYSDADNSLRISHGTVTDISSTSSFQSNLDSVHGNSGSPILGANGKCNGILRDGTPKANKLRATQFAGENILSRISEAHRLLRLSDLP